MPKLDEFIAEQLTHAESMSCKAVAGFLLLPRDAQNQCRPFLNLIGAQNKTACSRIETMHASSYAIRIDPWTEEFVRARQQKVDEVAKKTGSKHRRIASFSQELKAVASGRSKQDVAADSLTRKTRELAHLEEEYAASIEDAIKLAKIRTAEFLSFRDRNLTNGGARFLKEVYGTRPFEGPVYDFITAFAPAAAEKATRSEKTSASQLSVPSSPVSPVSLREEIAYAKAAGVPPSLVTSSAHLRPETAHSSHSRSFSIERNSITSAYAESNSDYTEDAFTVAPVEHRPLQPDEEIVGIEEGVASFRRYAEELDHHLASAPGQGPEVQALATEIGAAVALLRNDLADLRMRIYQRLEQPRQEARIESDALNWIGDRYGEHVAQRALPQLCDIIEELCRKQLTACSDERHSALTAFVSNISPGALQPQPPSDSTPGTSQRPSALYVGNQGQVVRRATGKGRRVDFNVD